MTKWRCEFREGGVKGLCGSWLRQLEVVITKLGNTAADACGRQFGGDSV